jgi:hypothetical protein
LETKDILKGERRIFMNLPEWLDAPKIAGLAILTLAFVQYLKGGIPEKFIRYFAMCVGVILSFACEIYIGSKLAPIKAIVNGAVAAVVADFTYGFLSKKGGALVLPSKTDLEVKK